MGLLRVRSLWAIFPKAAVQQAVSDLADAASGTSDRKAQRAGFAKLTFLDGLWLPLATYENQLSLTLNFFLSQGFYMSQGPVISSAHV